MNFVYISDFFLGETNGGAEQNDAELLNILVSRGHDVVKKKSDNIRIEWLEENKDRKFLISNFVFLFNRVRDKIIELGIDYIIIEHDHKYLITRDPSPYAENNYVAPESDLKHVDFYKNAKGVLCQSALHTEIVYSNLKFDNIYNVGGNLWTEETLDLLEELSKTEKVENRASIMQSQIIHKNTKGAIEYCQKADIDFELLKPTSHKEFLKEMAKSDTFVFFPLTVETLSRIVVEARMMNCKVKTSVNIGAASEPWFQLKGKELIDVMREKRNFVPNLIINIFDDE